MVNTKVIRVSKIILSILSWGPLIWTILILFAARFTFISPTTHSILYPFHKWIIIAAVFYVRWGGFFIWLSFNILLTWKKTITKKQCIYNILLTIIGLLCAYLSWHYDIFGLSGNYID